MSSIEWCPKCSGYKRSGYKWVEPQVDGDDDWDDTSSISGKPCDCPGGVRRKITIVYEAEKVDHEAERALLEAFYGIVDADERRITFHPTDFGEGE